MKKFFGKRDWSESLYYDVVTKEDLEFMPGWTEDDIYEGYSAPGFFDWEHYFGFRDKNVFHDTNDFITFSENFNVFQQGKI